MKFWFNLPCVQCDPCWVYKNSLFTNITLKNVQNEKFSWKHVQRIYFLFPIIICATIDFLYAAYYTLFTQFFKDVMWAFTGSTIWQYLILEEIINLEIKIHQYLIKTMVYTFFLPGCSREWDVTCWKKLTGQLFHTQ